MLSQALIQRAVGIRFAFLGRRVPLLAVVAAGIALVAGAGQAVGPILSGAITGSGAVTAQQGVVLTSDTFAYAALGDQSAIIAVNDEGTSFTAGIETYVSEPENAIYLNLDNRSNAQAHAILELDAPAGIGLEIDPWIGTDVLEAVIGPGRYLLSLSPDAVDEYLVVTVIPAADLKPGFYAIKGRLVQVDG